MTQALQLQPVQSLLGNHSAFLMPYRLRQSIQACPSPPAQRPVGAAHSLSPGNVPAGLAASEPGNTVAADLSENSSQPSKTPRLQVGSISTVTCVTCCLMCSPTVLLPFAAFSSVKLMCCLQVLLPLTDTVSPLSPHNR